MTLSNIDRQLFLITCNSTLNPASAILALHNLCLLNALKYLVRFSFLQMITVSLVTAITP